MMCRKTAAALCLALWPLAAAAAGGDDLDLVAKAVDVQILPGYQTLAAAAAELDAAAAEDCDPEGETLRDAYNSAFDAWIGVSHLRFGPSEMDNRAFALAFWPDDRGASRKTLAGVIREEDPMVDDAESFGNVSIAARGFFALEMMLYDGSLSEADPGYSCRLVRAITRDIATTAAAIEADWDPAYAELILHPGPENPIYLSDLEALQELYKALMTGLEFTADSRLGRPLGTFEKPRPKRAEAWRSGRSLRNVQISIAATSALAEILASDVPEETRAPLNVAIERAGRLAGRLNDPVFTGVETPTGRLRIEVLQQAVNDVRDASQAVIGPALGVSQGFNSLDGD